MHIVQRRLGDGPGGEVRLFTITNAAGSVFSCTNFGANILSLMVPDCSGELADVVLGYDHWRDYLTSTRNMAGVGGRYCGRIAEARFVLDGQEYLLTANNGQNHLHGGERGFHTKLWSQGRVWEADNACHVELICNSHDGEEGYPGNLTLRTTYSFDEFGTLTIRYRAITDKPTVMNVMNHLYLNLGGHDRGSVVGHMVQINSGRVAELAEGLIPTGEFLVVEGTPLDLTQPKPMLAADGDHPQLKLVGGFDHSYLLPKPWTLGQVRATVYEPVSRRLVEVRTTEPSLHFFTANTNLVGVRGKESTVYGKRPGFCLETQHFPNSPNQPKFPPTVLRPGTEFNSTTQYLFGVR